MVGRVPAESAFVASDQACKSSLDPTGFNPARIRSRYALFGGKPLLVDLYCGAGGASKGYHEAGFEVIGVDINPQPRYPYTFVRHDVRALPNCWLAAFDAIHASPPCQAYSPLGALSPDKAYPDLVAFTRALLDGSGVPYVIENVMSAPLVKERSIVLCGEMFGLRTYRHRRFESRLDLTAPEHPKHSTLTATKRRKERWAEGWHVSITGDVGTYVGPDAMGIDWMTGNELCQAIPPVYAEYIGRQLFAHVTRDRDAAPRGREAAEAEGQQPGPNEDSASPEHSLITPSQSASHGGLDTGATATSQRESAADIPVRSGQ